ncbi:MAG: hypothetical protein M1832_003904 [Thelocarpon impressellum]|nr:MAG: hypothetical protein M1832_003904 [Thelocarpon impressellum]
MVNLKHIRESNAGLRDAGKSGAVAVFVGATSGIGESTLKSFAEYADRPTLYLVGRSEAAASRILAEVGRLNPQSSSSFIAADVSLLKGVDAVCDEIRRKEGRLDLLVMSAGYLSFGGRNENAEGLDELLALRYYSRMRFIHNLLPLLTAAPSARVLSVLNAGREGKLLEDDLELRTHYSVMNCAMHSSTMSSLVMEALAARHPTVSFLHAMPGIVKTPIFKSGFSAPVGMLMGHVVAPLLTPFAIPVTEVGQRQLFHATSARYPPASPPEKAAAGVPLPAGTEVAHGADGRKGSGAYLLSSSGETVGDPKLLGAYRERGMPARVWDHTLAVFERVAGQGSKQAVV